LAKSGDAKREWKIWRRHGLSLRGLRFDPELAHYVLDPGKQVQGIGELSRQYLDLDLPAADGQSAAQIAAARADYSQRLVNVLRSGLVEAHVLPLFSDLEMPLTPVLGLMESHGVLVDVKQLQDRSSEVTKDLERLEKKAIDLAGHEFNLGSPRQLETIL